MDTSDVLHYPIVGLLRSLCTGNRICDCRLHRGELLVLADRFIFSMRSFTNFPY
jgi:hypothetical protein